MSFIISINHLKLTQRSDSKMKWNSAN